MSETVHHMIPAIAAVILGAAVHSILGFGCSLVWMSFFPLFTTVPEAVGILQPLGIGLNFLLITQLWKYASLKDLRPLIAVVPFGVMAGFWALSTFPPHMINGMLGTFLLLYVGSAFQEHHANEQKEKPPPPSSEEMHDMEQLEIQESTTHDSYDKNEDDRGTTSGRKYIAFPAAFVGGCLSSALGTGGPAILVYARESGWQHDPQKFRANLQIVLFSMNSLAVTSQVYAGIVNRHTLGTSLQLAPALILGGWAGTAIAPRVRKDIFHNLTLYGLAIMGALFVFKAFKEQRKFLFVDEEE
eukprot:scaffold119_cov131-Cylindrotheca_fusiformis.AAC.9